MLDIRNVSINFGALLALDDISLTVGDGELVGVIGPNGAGKTTFFNVLSGHYAPTGGSVQVDRRRVSGLPPWKVARIGVSRTFQNPRVFKRLSCRQNVVVALETRGWRSWVRNARAMDALADEWLDFVGLGSMADEPGGSLSYGSLRRLEIARACAREPKALLLDEPAAGMNSSERAELMELITRINERGTSVLLIEHNMPLVLGLCPRVAVLNFGRMIACGTPDEIREDPLVVEAYLGSEATEEEIDAAEEQIGAIGEAGR